MYYQSLRPSRLKKRLSSTSIASLPAVLTRRTAQASATV